MKTTLLLFLILPIASFAQLKFDCNSGNPQFQEAFEIPEKSAADLYTMVNRWVALTYSNPDAATMAKLENEMVRGKGFEKKGVKIAAGAFSDMFYSWRIDVKDGKVRFTMDEMRTSDYNFGTYVCKSDGSTRTNSQATNIKDSFELKARLLIDSLKKDLLNPDKKKDDW